MQRIFILVLFVFVCNVHNILAKSSIFQGTTLEAEKIALMATDACTTIGLGKLASVDGSTMTTHTNDCAECDPRLAKVPASSGVNSATSFVYLDKQNYPRYVGYSRGSTYYPENLDHSIREWPLSVPIGTIDGVKSTFGYIEGSYGIINEKQLAIGESTCGAKLASTPVSSGGSALFSIRGLTRIAMERCETAQCAVDLIGSLAVKYGIYGEVWEGPSKFGEAGEALTIADPEEVWVFHILPDDTGSSAVWVAQRVPDDHITVVANQFVIQKVNLSSPDFKASDNIFEVAQRNNFWDPDHDGEFDFTKAYALSRHSLSTYATRRVWRVFTLADPSLDLSPYTDDFASDYPFSVKPSRLLSVQDVMNFQRDHYEGTEFDLTQGPAGGPSGDPNRFDPVAQPDLTMEQIMKGKFERAISIHRTSYAFVTQSRRYLPDQIGGLVWFSTYAPHASYFTPLYSNIIDVPAPLKTGSLYRYDSSSSFWTSVLLGNYAARFYLQTIDRIKNTQNQYELEIFAKQEILENKVQLLLSNETEDDVKELLTNFSDEQAIGMHSTWKALFEFIVTTYHDGFIFYDLTGPTLLPKKIFYPTWWLNMVGFFPTVSSSEISQPKGKVYYGYGVVLGISLSAFIIGGFVSMMMSNYMMKKNTRRYYAIN